jgi:hypothetical protein
MDSNTTNHLSWFRKTCTPLLAAKKDPWVGLVQLVFLVPGNLLDSEKIFEIDLLHAGLLLRDPAFPFEFALPGRFLLDEWALHSQRQL